ncbi:MAG TPA: STAS domain-containing protein [Thermotogota bacterium]|nr:STAS domain-containing protein [Thermotogota bacterium]HRW93723.1 STAS domain-containing protein [Thermotogota bacterium]
MQIQASEEKGIHVVRIGGRLDGASAPQLEKQLRLLLDQKVTRLVLDLEKMNYISSAGLRVLLVVARELDSGSGTIALCNLNPEVREVFDVAGFSEIFPIHSSRQGALESLEE